MEWVSVSTYGCSVLTYLALQMVFACLEHRRQKRRTAEGMGHGAEGTQHGDRDRGEWPLGESHSCATVRQDPSAPRRWLPGESHTCASVGEPPTSHRQCPSVTVVLPTFNEPVANLRACVHSVLNQSYPGRIQVVVVDDGSDEPVSEASLGLSCASTAGDTEIAAAIAGPPNSKSESACGGRNPKPIQDPNPQMLKTTDSWFGASAGSGLTATKDGNCEIASSRNSGTRNDDFCTQDEWKEHETGPILWPEGGSPVQSQIRLRGRRSTATAHESVASPESQMPFSPGHVQIQTVGMPSSRASGVHRLADGLAVTSHCTPEGSQSERLPRNRRCEVLVLPENRGKRHAQKAAFDRAEGEYIVTADGDTVLHPDALIALVQAMEPWSDAGVARGMGTGDHPGLPEVRDGLARVGAATASIRVRNTNSLFTTLLELRYWCAGHQERASQSYFGVMVCCSGALSIYRRELVDALKHEYVKQRFLGKECTFGDDRHLTNLILREGWDTKFVPDAQAWTLAPERILKWLRQQRRWSQSFYRECWWSLRFMHRRNVYFGYNLLVGGLMPLFLAYGLIAAGVHVAQTHWWMAGKYVATVFLMAWIRGAYGLWLTRDWKFLLMPVYGLLHLVGVMPVRLYALFTLGNTSWGTRTAGALSGTGGTGFDGVWPISAEAQGSGK